VIRNFLHRQFEIELQLKLNSTRIEGDALVTIEWMMWCLGKSFLVFFFRDFKHTHTYTCSFFFSKKQSDEFSRSNCEKCFTITKSKLSNANERSTIRSSASNYCSCKFDDQKHRQI